MMANTYSLINELKKKNISNGVHKLSKVEQEKTSFANNPECKFYRNKTIQLNKHKTSAQFRNPED